MTIMVVTAVFRATPLNISKMRARMYTEDIYPYKANDTGTSCSHFWNPVGAKVDQVFNITAKDEDELVHAIADFGPVGVAYQASHDFVFYSHEIFD